MKLKQLCKYRSFKSGAECARFALRGQSMCERHQLRLKTKTTKKAKKKMRGTRSRYSLHGGEPRTLYFAYGSNLYKDHMEARCPQADPVGRLLLPNYRLTFRGVADIEPCRGDHVEGGLFAITPRCEQLLDRYEGVPSLYRKEYFVVKVGDGKTEQVLFYKMNSGGVAPPGDMYLKTIMRGFADFSLDMSKLDEAVARSIRANRAVNRREQDGEVVVDCSDLPILAALAERNRKR